MDKLFEFKMDIYIYIYIGNVEITKEKSSDTGIHSNVSNVLACSLCPSPVVV